MKPKPRFRHSQVTTLADGTSSDELVPPGARNLAGRETGSRPLCVEAALAAVAFAGMRR